MPDRMPEDMPDRMPEDMSDRMPEDLPVTKCINVMVGITRSKVIFCFWKVAAFKAFSISQPGPAPAPPLSQPAPQASSPPAPQRPSAPQPPGSAPCLAQGQSSSPGLLYVLYTHILLCCYLGSIRNPKQCFFAISNITTDKVLTSWMHEAFQ